MSLLPIVLISLLLAGAALLAWAARPRPSTVGAPIASIGHSPLVPAAAVAVPLLALLVWLLLRSGVDGAAWQLSGVVLWLLVATVAWRLLGDAAAPLPAAPLAAAFALTAAALPALWLGDERARLGAVALFAVVRLAVGWREANSDVARSLVGLALAVLLLWAAAVGGVGSPFFALAAAAHPARRMAVGRATQRTQIDKRRGTTGGGADSHRRRGGVVALAARRGAAAGSCRRRYSRRAAEPAAGAGAPGRGRGRRRSASDGSGAGWAGAGGRCVGR